MTGRKLKACVVTYRTILSKATKEAYKIEYMCDRGGKYTGKGVFGLRKTFTKKCECPFFLQGYLWEGKGWNLTVKNDSHNHSPVAYVEGRAFFRRFTDAEKKLIFELWQAETANKFIHARLQDVFTDNCSILRDVSNYTAKLKKQYGEKKGRTPMQVNLPRSY